MSSFIAGARSQLQLITEHRAGGTRSAFRSALGLLFAINPFHTKLHNLLLPNLNPHSHIRTPQLILYSLAMLMLSPLYLCFSLWFLYSKTKSLFLLSALFTQFSFLNEHLDQCDCDKKVINTKSWQISIQAMPKEGMLLLSNLHQRQNTQSPKC